MLPETDNEGFLTRPEQWTRGVAESIAEGLVPDKLEEDHWKIIDYLRDYYVRYESVPPLRMICRETGLDAPYLRKLFPHNCVGGACKIAGVPQVVTRGLL